MALLGVLKMTEFLMLGIRTACSSARTIALVGVLAVSACDNAEVDMSSDERDRQSPGPVAAGSFDESPVDWFRDAKFGMFIHWGVYSHLGGNLDGQRYYGITEWIMRRGEIPAEEYKALAGGFNPV